MSIGQTHSAEGPLFGDLLAGTHDFPAGEMEAFAADIVEIDPTACSVFAGNGRAQTAFDRKKNAALIADIEKNGQQTPVLVRLLNETYEVVAGTRRLGAVASLRERYPDIRLKAHILNLTEEQAWALADKENANRRDLTPLQRARSWSYAVQNFHGGRQDLFAASVGEDASVVSRTLGLLKIPDEVLSALRNPEGVSVHFAAQLMPALQDRERAEEILATARNLSSSRRRMSGPELLEALLSTPAEISERAPVEFDLGSSSRHAVFKRKPNGSATLSFKAFDSIDLDVKTRKSFLASIDRELKRFLQLEARPAIAKSNGSSSLAEEEGDR